MGILWLSSQTWVVSVERRTVSLSLPHPSRATSTLHNQTQSGNTLRRMTSPHHGCVWAIRRHWIKRLWSCCTCYRKSTFSDSRMRNGFVSAESSWHKKVLANSVTFFSPYWRQTWAAAYGSVRFTDHRKKINVLPKNAGSHYLYCKTFIQDWTCHFKTFILHLLRNQQSPFTTRKLWTRTRAAKELCNEETVVLVELENTIFCLTAWQHVFRAFLNVYFMKTVYPCVLTVLKTNLGVQATVQVHLIKYYYKYLIQYGIRKCDYYTFWESIFSSVWFEILLQWSLRHF